MRKLKNTQSSKISEVFGFTLWQLREGSVTTAGAETSNEEQFHYRQSVLVAIGLVSTQTWERLVGKTEAGF